MSHPEDFAVLARKLEDGCNIATTDSEAALISGAISLKRIADALQPTISTQEAADAALEQDPLHRIAKALDLLTRCINLQTNQFRTRGIHP